jgi:hypothetical protein
MMLASHDPKWKVDKQVVKGNQGGAMHTKHLHSPPFLNVFPCKRNVFWKKAVLAMLYCAVLCMVVCD